MKPSRPLITRPIKPPPPPSLYLTRTCKLSPNVNRVFDSRPLCSKFPVTLMTKSSRNEAPLPASTHSSSPAISSNMGRLEALEENIEKVIYRFRFMALLGVFGSLIGSFLCFIKCRNRFAVDW
ncbi:hypothetical protein Patl1_02665 [Pistacia atlantica]|uniref:Uncharacterized protein n=1 Tax=Pistacia atlantica TaxID=434234 RepID=A0ACC1C4U1_9ROSI|nr:hypothetical protein Patl1_02665 [Pistacia atlantica]